jgi:hypothetical protein
VELIFESFLKKQSDLKPSVGSLQGWLLKAYVNMEEKGCQTKQKYGNGIRKYSIWFSPGIKQDQT